MNNNKQLRSNNFTAHPLKENNQEEDFFLKSEKNRNLFLKFSENARKNIQNITFKFDADHTKKENSKIFESNNEICKNKIFGLKEDNKNFENPFTYNNLGKSMNTNLVFDYYSKVKKPQSNNLGVENFTENLSKLKSKKKSNTGNKTSSKINKNENYIEQREFQNKIINYKVGELTEKSLIDKTNFYGTLNKMSNFTNDPEKNQLELDLMLKQNLNFIGDNTNNQNRTNNDLPLQLENVNSNDIYHNPNNNYITKNFNVINVNENNNDFNINPNKNSDELQADFFLNPLNNAYNKDIVYTNFHDVKDQESVIDFNSYIQKCMNLNKKVTNPFSKTNYIIKDLSENINEQIYNNPNNNIYHQNYIPKPVNLNNNNLNEYQQNPNINQESYIKETEQNYENFTQDFFFERYGHYLPSVLTPTSFNRDITQFLRKEKEDKSEASSRIINIKCQPIRNPSFNLVNKMNQINFSKEGLKIDSKSHKENEKNHHYVYSDLDKEDIKKFDFSKLGQEIENAYYNYDLNPISIDGRKIIQNNFSDEYNQTQTQKHVCFDNFSLFKWIKTYNKILGNQAFLNEYNLKKFKTINPDTAFDILKNRFSILKNQSSSNEYSNYNLVSLNNFEILNILYNFFINFSVSQKIKDNKINLILKLKVCKFVDSLKIFEAKDFYDNEIQIAYILPLDYYEFSNIPNNRRRNPNAGDTIFVRNFNNMHSDEAEKVYFLEEKDFEIIL